MSRPRIVVLGAGPTGLGAALGAVLNDPEARVTVIERAAKPGGLAGSFSWRGHTIDYGPHRLSILIDDIRVLAEEFLGPDCLVKPSQHGVQFDGTLYQFPPRSMDWLTPGSLLEAAATAGSWIAGQVRWVTSRFDEDTFERVMTRKFGWRFYDRVIVPMSRKVWAEPDQIDPQFAVQRFSQIEPLQVLRKLLFPRQEINPVSFYYPRKGFQQLWDNIAEYLRRRGSAIRFQTSLSRLEVSGGRITRIVTRGHGGEEVLEGDGLTVVSTIPLPSLVDLLDGCPTDDLIRQTRNVRIRSMLLATFEFDQPRTLPFRTLIFPQEDFCFNRLFEQNEYSRDTVGEGKSVIAADITLPRGDDRLARPDEEILNQVRSDLSRLRCIDCSRITAEHVERVPFAYVVPDLGTRQAMYRVQHALKQIAGLELAGRFATGEYDNSDYALERGMMLGAVLCGKLSRMEYLRALHSRKIRPIVG